MFLLLFLEAWITNARVEENCACAGQILPCVVLCFLNVLFGHCDLACFSSEEVDQSSPCKTHVNVKKHICRV